MRGKNHTGCGIRHAGGLHVRRNYTPSSPVEPRIPHPLGVGRIHEFSGYTPLRVHEAQNAQVQWIITLASDLDVALHAENKSATVALEALSEALAAEELTMLHATVDTDSMILDKRPKSPSFKPTDEIVKF